jgi:hypothetical protein
MPGDRSAKGVIAPDLLAAFEIGEEAYFGLVQFGSSSATAQPNRVTNWGFFKGALAAASLNILWLGSAFLF